jgi:adenylate cyclase
MTLFKKERAFIGFIITICIAGIMLLGLSPFETIEQKLLDFRFKTRGEMIPPGNIVIAAIDDKSIEKLGRYPWDRDVFTRIVERLTAVEPDLIVFDVLFPDKEENDHMLGGAIREAGNVLLPISFDFEKETGEKKNQFLSNTSLFYEPGSFQEHQPIRSKGILLPVPELIREAMALGHINMIPDDDGTMRWECMVIENNGFIYPSIDLMAGAINLGIPLEKIVVRAKGGIALGKKCILPTDRWRRLLINYYGPDRSFERIPVSDILEGQVKPERLMGKIIIIGVTALGVYDLRVTPFSPAMPGVEKHANVIASIVDNKFLKQVPLSLDIVSLLISGFLFSLIIARFRAVGASIHTGIFLFLILLTGHILFSQQGYWINLIYPLSNILLIFITVTVYNYAVEERYAKRIRAMFSSYVTERVVKELIKNPEMSKLGGDRREVTVLFSDIRGFTTFSEKHSSEEVVSRLNEFLGAMTEVIFRWEGTLDKFVGDEIVAFWGAPMRQENHAELAVRCALNMVKRLEELQQQWKREGKTVLDSGIGLNTGQVVVGNIGAEGKKMDYTVIGDSVNIGARVEALTRKYNVPILITGSTLSKIQHLISDEGDLGHVDVKGLDKVLVKGKEKPVILHSIKAKRPGARSAVSVK